MLRKSSYYAGALLPLLAASVHAEDLTNANVLPNMNGGASTYTLEAYTMTLGETAINIGNTTSSNALTIKNGASLANGSTRNNLVSIGLTLTSTLNSVIVTGTGSSLSAAGNFAIGNLGLNNSLTITDGGSVTPLKATYLGQGSSSNAAAGVGNTLTISGASSKLAGTGSVFAGYNGSQNTVFIENGGLLRTNDRFWIGYGNSNSAALGSNNVVTIRDVGSRVESNGYVTLGYTGSNNTLTLSNGATIDSGGLQIGNGSVLPGYGSSNSAIVTGAGTDWTMDGLILVGNFGNTNSLTIENGASVVNDGEVVVGQGNFGSTILGQQNHAAVRGENTKWLNSSTLVVGRYGAGNKMTISDGGTMTNGATKIGEDTTASGNTLEVKGEGSSWTAAGDLAIGASGNSGNALEVTDRGLAVVGNADAPTATVTIATGNFLRIDGGFVTLYGDQTALVTSLLSQNSIQIFNDGAWVTASVGEVRFQFFAASPEGNSGASDFTGGLRDDLGGYTVVTAAAVPEPGPVAMLGLSAGVLLVWRRRKFFR
jgi:T5SS/PEP-CTERM-associated repeat protein